MDKLIALRYTNALFDLAKQQNMVESFGEDVKAIHSAIISDKDFLTVLNHPQISGDEKLKLFETALKGKVNDDILGLIAVALNKNRETDIVMMLELFLEKVEQYKGIVTANVYSASKLKPEQINKLKLQLSQNLKKQVEIKEIVSPEIIGGIKIEVDGHVIDSSIQRHLSEIKKQLLNIQLA